MSESKAEDTSTTIHEPRLTPAAGPPAETPPEQRSRLKFGLLVTSLALQALIAGYDVSNMANIQAALFEAFGKLELIPVASMGYSAGASAMMPVGRRLTHFVNMKRLHLGLGVVFIVAGVVTATAHSMEVIVLGRFLLGISGGPMMMFNFTYVTFSTAPYNAQVTSLMGSSFAIGLLLGPVVGGAVTQHSTWRWAFGIAPILLAATVPLTVIAFPSKIDNNNGQDRSAREELRSFDIVGAVLQLGSVFLLLFAIAYSGTRFAWGSAGNVALFVVWGVVFIAYIVQQATCTFTTPERRILPLHVLGTRDGALVFLCTNLISVVYSGPLYYIPLLFAFAHGLSPIGSAVKLLPYIAGFIVGTFFTGGTLPKVGRYPPYYIAANALALVGSAVISATTTTTTPVGRVVGLAVIIGVGVGMLMQHGLTVLVAALDKSMFSDISTAAVTGQYLGGCLGLALMGCIYQNKGFELVRAVVDPSLGFDDATVRQLLGGLKSGALEAVADPAQRELIVKAVTKTITLTLYVLTASAAAGLLAALGMRWDRLTFRPPQKGAGGEKVPEESEVEGVSVQVGQSGGEEDSAGSK